MNIFLFICLAVGWASTEKLDRSYLPPPGSKFSGGSPGDIQVPLEFPKENYSTQRPQAEDGVPEIELGINRRPLSTGTVQGSTQRPDGFTYFQNSYSVPKTTTSYAFTQTTTFAPVDYEGLDENSGFLNASTGVQQRPQYPQQLGQNYQQRQPIRGQSPSKGPIFNQYQEGQNFKSTSAPYGSTTQNPRAYLPPVPSFNNNGQSPSGQLSYDRGYPSGRPQGPKYQDGQRFTSTTKPSFTEGGNQQNVFIGNPTTVSPQNQNERFMSTTGPVVNQQKFGSRVPTQQNQQSFQGQNFPSSTAAPQFTTPEGLPQNIYEDQKFPSSSSAPQYQYGQRLTTPGSYQQGYGSRIPQQNQNKYLGSENFPSTTSAPQYQAGQQFVTPGLVQQNQYTGNQEYPSTTALQYQNTPNYPTPGTIQEGFVPKQQKFGSRIPNLNSQNQYIGNQNFPSTTAVSQSQNGQRFTTPGAVQQTQQNQHTENQNIPSSTTAPQYQYEQRYTRPGSTEQYGSPATDQQNQNQYPGNQNFPSSTTAPQYQNGQRDTTPGSTEQFGSPAIVPQNQQQYPGIQNFHSSTTAPQYQNGQRYTTPESTEQFGSPAVVPQNQHQYPGIRNFPSSTTAPQYQNGQRYTTPGSQDQQFGSPVPSQQNQNQYSGNQFFPSTTAPQSENKPQEELGKPGFTQQGQNQYQGNQNIPSSTVRPQYQNGQFVTPGFVQDQYLGNQNNPSTVSPQIQDGQRFVSGQQNGVGLNQQNYPGSQAIAQNGQYPTTAAPQYQSTFTPISESNQGSVPNQQNLNQYPGRPGYNQQFPSTMAPKGFLQQQYGDDGKPILPDTGASYPAIKGTPSTQTSPAYGNQPSSLTGAPVYGPTPSAPGYINQGVPSVTPGSLGSGTGIIAQNRPERPQAASDRTAEILSYENVLTPEGYSYSFDTSNGIHADETGVVDDGTKAQGGYSYIGDDGKVYSVLYSADENGFQPRGDHLPTPPPIPEAIQRVIEQANKDKEAGISDDGLYDEEKYGHSKYDGSLRSFRPQNKTDLLINGADIPNSYKSRIGGKTRNQMKHRGEKKPNYQDEEENTDLKYVNDQDQIHDEIFGDSNSKETDRGVPNKYSTDDKDFTNEAKRRKTQKGKTTSNGGIESTKNRKPVGVDRRPVSSMIKEDGTFDNMPVTEIPEEDDDVERSQDYNDESDLINYKDDPNSRTDFHGINRYLPNPKGSNRFNQTDSKRILIRPGDTKQKGTSVNKFDRTGNRKNQGNDNTIPGIENEQETNNNNRIRVPNRNRIGQKNMESSKINHQGSTDSNDESNTYGDDGVKITEEYASDDELVSGEGDLPSQPGVLKSKQKLAGKPTRPNVNERTGISKTNIKTISEEETGYEYTPPQRKFNSEGAIRFPSRTSVTGKPQFPQKGIQTTVRPFMTPNVYGNDKTNEDDEDQYDSEGKPYRPMRPTTPQDRNNPENVETNDRLIDNDSGMTEREIFDATGKPIAPYNTTPSRRPFGRPQTTAMPGYKDQDTIGQDRYNEPVNYQGPRRPGSKMIYSTDAPNKGASKVESNAFVSTTPLPSIGYETYKDNQSLGPYQNTNMPNDGASNFEGTAPSKDGQKSTPYKPGITDSRGQVPSTTFRPNYTFGDKTLAPSGPIAVDGFGRQISSTNAPIYGTTNEPVPQGSRVPIENQPDKVREFRPSVGRFGVTSAPAKGTIYQGSTPGPVENFGGPKQPQRFDPDTGYHYK